MAKFTYRRPRAPPKMFPRLLRQIVLAGLGIWGLVQLLHMHSNRIPITQPKIAKVTMVYGNNTIYDQAFATHQFHAERFGYPVYNLRQPIIDQTFNKYAILLSVLLEELAKPEGQRLEWLFWHDADTVLMNPNMPLETFLPPDHYRDVHLLLTKDWNGMNNGVFFLRVHEWSVNLMSAAIAYPMTHPDVDLFWPDQSALTNIFDEFTTFSRSVVYVPMRWINPYMRSPDGRSKNLDSPDKYQVHPGDLLVHFPGTPREYLNQTLSPYIAIAQGHEPEWEPMVDETGYIAETFKFWNNLATSRGHYYSPVADIEDIWEDSFEDGFEDSDIASTDPDSEILYSEPEEDYI